MDTPRERAQRVKERQEFMASLALREDYRRTFETEHGRRVLEDLITRGHMLETTCSGNAWSYFYEGERNVALRIMGIIPQLVGEVLMGVARQKQSDLNKTIAQVDE